MARREQDTSRDFSYHDRKPISVREQQEFIVSALPSIGITNAKNLLSSFGSVRSIVNANQNDLLQVEGIGEKTADRLVSLFKEEYKK